MLRPRVLAYAALLLALAGFLVGSLATRNPLRVDVIRDRASLARFADNGDIENTYTLQLLNASERPLVLELSASGLPGLRIAGQNRIEVPAASNRLVPIALQLPADTDQRPGSHPIKIEVTPVNPPDQEDGPSASARHEDSIFMVPR